VFIAYGASLILSVFAIAIVLKFSHRKKWYDHINDRKIHTGDIPRLGGIGFSLVFVIGAFIINLIYGGNINNRHYLPCFIAILITIVANIFDDFSPISPKYKFLSQFAAALLVIIPGYTFKRLFYIEGNFLGDIGWLSYPLTFLWIVGLTNAVNLLDGVDGLAGGLSALIAFFTALITFSVSGPSMSVHVYAVFIGVITGFLIFNAPLPKARIFMGDCGSQFLGFTLALLTLMKDNHDRGSLPLFYAAALFAIPILDTTSAVWRRIRDGRKIYEPDKWHIHHKLMKLGLDVRGIDALLYSLQIILGILVFIAAHKEGRVTFVYLGAAYLIALTFFSTIHFLSHARLKRDFQEDNAQQVNGK
jgi:UDP-GlcNAc:undecaprenyl-phosphate GlcNAc-1-phosphate transferase